ncbi:YopX family protein [Bacillus swezeyi]|uniref:YopX family protein n=1 Tax=Bacillus swezeyi TaxID=1925020 RepID=UPI0039C71FE1
MREIKFRAWYTEKRDGKEFPRMIYWDEMINDQDEELACYFRNEFSDVSPLMQYTGLKGENGREIWEGDIRKDVRGRKFKVVYDNDLAAFYGEYINVPSESLADCGPDSEYLGTVYENPDLLEAAE